MLVQNWTLINCSLVRPEAAAAGDWRDLVQRALVPSGHNAPELVFPALKADPSAILALVRDSEGLQLALPLRAPHFAVLAHSNVSTPVSYFGLPHLGRDKASAALQALLRKLDGPLLLHSVPVDGPLWTAIEEASGYFAAIDCWERAVLCPVGSYENWLDENFERKRRKEYRRLQARLSEQGRFEALNFCAEDDAAQWANEFLELEAAGWKGKRGTAIKANEAAAAMLRESCQALSRAGKLRFWKLALDGKPIAMLYAVVENNEAWLGKIAFDEGWAKYSPGVLLILHATEQLFAENVTQADSCAIPDHPMINHLWRDRLKVADVMLGSPALSEAKFNFAVNIERTRRWLRTRARTIYYKLTGRHRS